MKVDDLFSYLIATDQLDDTLGLKNIEKCPKCNEELYIYDNNILYCKRCKYMFNYLKKDKIYNKKLTYTEKMNIKE